MSNTSKYYFRSTDDGFNITHVYQEENDWYWDMFLLMPLGILRFPHKHQDPKEDYEARGHKLLLEEVGTRMLKRFDDTIDLFSSSFISRETVKVKQESDRVYYFVEKGNITLLRSKKNGTIYKLEFDRNHIIYKRMSDPDMLEYYDLYYFDPKIADEMIRAYRKLRKDLKDEKQSFLSSPF